eukprot:11196962-Prorocentrum_lima.AAC.1
MHKFGSILLTRCTVGGVHINALCDALARYCHKRRAALQLIDAGCVAVAMCRTAARPCARAQQSHPRTCLRA